MNSVLQVVHGNESIERIVQFHNRIDELLIPRLSSRVDIAEYAKKLAQRALNIFVTVEREDIGICSIYCNEAEAFITSFAVCEEYQGMGIGMQLMRRAIHLAKSSGCSCILLDVHFTNTKAKRFYLNNGFSIITIGEQWIRMKLEL